MTEVTKTCALICDTQFLAPLDLEKGERAVMLQSLVRHETGRAARMGYIRFLCGFTGPADFLLAEAVIEARHGSRDIRLESVLAYEDEAAGWKERMREVYFNLLGQCDAEHLIQTRFTNTCIVARNRYLVDRAQMLIAISDGLLGNATQAVHYAASRDKTIVCISPSSLATRKFG